MYWFRTENEAVILVWICITLIHTFGGWLIATHAFNLQSKERFLVGFGIGLVLYLCFCNFFGRWIDPTLTFVISSIIVLVIGISFGVFSSRPFIHWDDLKIWPWILIGLVLIWVFLNISKGTGMFDEYKNLALISVIANGEIPVREYFGYPDIFHYHYGYHFWGASLMRLGGLMPWSAFDLSKSIIWGYTILLAGLLGERYIPRRWGAILMGSITTLSGGTRYLLLLLPTGVLVRLNDSIQLMGVSQDLGNFIDAMKSGWFADGTPPVDYPFAFLSGIKSPYVMAHTGSGTFELTLLFLFILLAPRMKKVPSFILLTLLLSFWALTAEASFVLICMGIALYFLWQQFRTNRSFKHWKQESILFLVTIFVAGIISMVQGGTITAMIEGYLANNQAQSSLVIAPVIKPDTKQPIELFGFSLRWPPAVLSGHLGSLPIFSLLGILAAIFEIGIIIVFLPWLTKRILQTDPQINWLDRVLLISAWIGIVLPIFVQWQSGRDITHLSSFGMDVFLYLYLVYLSRNEHSSHPIIYNAGWLALALTTFSGIVLAGTQLTATPNTIYSEHYTDYDATLLKQVWGEIPRDSKVYGQVGKGSILTGQLTAGMFTYPRNEREVWAKLYTDPTIEGFIENGFEFVYFDSERSRSFQEEANHHQCVKVFGYAADRSGENYVGFYDLRACTPP